MFHVMTLSLFRSSKVCTSDKIIEAVFDCTVELNDEFHVNHEEADYLQSGVTNKLLDWLVWLPCPKELHWTIMIFLTH
uniref:Uncharacterized protein n=1 Tax=Arion vulgaris TaxID=1028688 RepID=A0A0B7ANI0_9EUPU